MKRKSASASATRPKGQKPSKRTATVRGKDASVRTSQQAIRSPDEPVLAIWVTGGASKMKFNASASGLGSVDFGIATKPRVIYKGPLNVGSFQASVTASEPGDPDDSFLATPINISIDLGTLSGGDQVVINQVPGDPGRHGEGDESESFNVQFGYKVTPAVKITDADVEHDRIVVDCKPAGASGILKITLIGLEGASEQIYYDTNAGTTLTETFHLDRFTNVQSEKTFTHVEAEWSVGGMSLRSTASLKRPFEFLGIWKITNYFTPVLRDFAANNMLPRGTGTFHEGHWANLRDVNYPANFLNAVDLGTEGLGQINGHVVRFHGAGRNQRATAWIGNRDGRRYYLADPDPDQQTASCPPHNLLGTTDTIASRSRKLRCDAEVMIQGIQGVKVKRDTGGGLLDRQIDIYIGEGGDALYNQANTWGEKMKWVINLLLK